MIDIVSADELGLGLYNTDVEKAKNVLSIQLGSLSFLQDFGIDLKYFLSEDFAFENESFKSYCVQRLANYAINVTSVIQVVNSLSEDLKFNIGANPSDGSLVVR